MRSKGSLKLIREINSSIILEQLKQNAPLSKYDISKETGLSAPTVTHIMNDLIEIGIVKEVGMGESIGGRPPLLLDLNLEGGFIIGVDISSDDITSIVVDFLGNIVSKSISPMDEQVTDYMLIDKIFSTISDSINKSKKDRALFFGMGIGVSGDIDTEKGIIIQASRLNWNQVPLKSIVENSFHMPAFIEENVRLLSFAENWFGAGKDFKDILCIRVGDDIGAGIILNGELYGGSGGFAGVNLGHIIIQPDGEKCECGNKGCLQTLVSGAAIVKRAQASIIKDNDSDLLSYINNPSRPLTVKTIADAAKKGSPLCMKVMDETAMYLAIAVSNLVNILDPELVIIGGGIAESGEALFDPLNKYIRSFQFKNPNLKVVPSKLGADAYAMGAAIIVLHQIFSEPKKFMSKRRLKQQKN